MFPLHHGFIYINIKIGCCFLFLAKYILFIGLRLYLVLVSRCNVERETERERKKWISRGSKCGSFLALEQLERERDKLAMNLCVWSYVYHIKWIGLYKNMWYYISCYYAWHNDWMIIISPYKHQERASVGLMDTTLFFSLIPISLFLSPISSPKYSLLHVVAVAVVVVVICSCRMIQSVCVRALV